MGFVYLACIWMFYVLIPIYVLRSLAISFLMRDVVASAPLRILRLHPDHCGGLRPVGRLGLRDQYGLSVFGVNVVLLGGVDALPHRALVPLLHDCRVRRLCLRRADRVHRATGISRGDVAR